MPETDTIDYERCSGPAGSTRTEKIYGGTMQTLGADPTNLPLSYTTAAVSPGDLLAARYQEVRRFSEGLCEHLVTEG